jgi:hypothetical protein
MIKIEVMLKNDENATKVTPEGHMDTATDDNQASFKRL